MTDRELKKLSRAELLEMLIDQSDENEKLKAELESVREELKLREIKVDEAGSIAEAAIKINGVFEAAQAAADQYLENIHNVEMACEKMRSDAEKEAEQIIVEAQVKATMKEEEAKEHADKYWTEVSRKLEHFFEEHKEIQELLINNNRRNV